MKQAKDFPHVPVCARKIVLAAVVFTVLILHNTSVWGIESKYNNQQIGNNLEESANAENEDLAERVRLFADHSLRVAAYRAVLSEADHLFDSDGNDQWVAGKWLGIGGKHTLAINGIEIQYECKHRNYTGEKEMKVTIGKDAGASRELVTNPLSFKLIRGGKDSRYGLDHDAERSLQESILNCQNILRNLIKENIGSDAENLKSFIDKFNSELKEQTGSDNSKLVLEENEGGLLSLVFEVGTDKNARMELYKLKKDTNESFSVQVNEQFYAESKKAGKKPLLEDAQRLIENSDTLNAKIKSLQSDGFNLIRLKEIKQHDWAAEGKYPDQMIEAQPIADTLVIKFKIKNALASKYTFSATRKYKRNNRGQVANIHFDESSIELLQAITRQAEMKIKQTFIEIFEMIDPNIKSSLTLTEIVEFLNDQSYRNQSQMRFGTGVDYKSIELGFGDQAQKEIVFERDGTEQNSDKKSELSISEAQKYKEIIRNSLLDCDNSVKKFKKASKKDIQFAENISKIINILKKLKKLKFENKFLFSNNLSIEYQKDLITGMLDVVKSAPNNGDVGILEMCNDIQEFFKFKIEEDCIAITFNEDDVAIKIKKTDGDMSISGILQGNIQKIKEHDAHTELEAQKKKEELKAAISVPAAELTKLFDLLAKHEKNENIIDKWEKIVTDLKPILQKIIDQLDENNPEALNGYLKEESSWTFDIANLESDKKSDEESFYIIAKSKDNGALFLPLFSMDSANKLNIFTEEQSKILFQGINPNDDSNQKESNKKVSSLEELD